MNHEEQTKLLYETLNQPFNDVDENGRVKVDKVISNNFDVEKARKILKKNNSLFDNLMGI